MPKRQRKFVRKDEAEGRPNLRVVPAPKPRRRTRLKIGRVRKVKFPPELLRFEEDTVLRVVREMDGRASVRSLMDAYPGRFRRKQLWWVLLRLADDERLKTAPGLGLTFHRRQGNFNFWTGRGTWFERHRVQERREFWTQ